MRGWGRDAYGEGRYGNGRAPRYQRVLVLLVLCLLSWLVVGAIFYLT